MAKRLGCSVATVAKQRAWRKIAPCEASLSGRHKDDNVDWDAQPWASKTLSEIAKLTGFSISHVSKRRREHTDLPLFKDSFNWDLAPWGEMSDGEMGRRLGFSAVTVGIQRRKRGIEAVMPDGDPQHVRFLAMAMECERSDGTPSITGEHRRAIHQAIQEMRKAENLKEGKEK
jgi:hypothetical protein